MSYDWIAGLMFTSMLVMLMTGQRMFGIIGFVAVVAALLLWGDRGGYDLAFAQTIKVMNWFPLLSLPMFIFMGYVLSESRLADDLYRMFHVWFGPVPGAGHRDDFPDGADLGHERPQRGRHGDRCDHRPARTAEAQL